MFRWTLYPIGKALVWLVLRIYGPVRIKGRSNVPKDGPLLVCANHLSDADPPTMFYAVPRPVWFMAKEEIFGIRLVGWVAKMYRSFPVKRGSPDRTAIRRAEELLKNGECLVIFPEGECSETGTLLPLLHGASLIIQRTGVPCVCAGIIGTNRIMPYGSVRPQRARGRVSVEFGSVLNLEVEPGRAGLEEITRRLTSELARLTGQDPPDQLTGAAPLDERKDLDAAT